MTPRTILGQPIEPGHHVLAYLRNGALFETVVLELGAQPGELIVRSKPDGQRAPQARQVLLATPVRALSKQAFGAASRALKAVARPIHPNDLLSLRRVAQQVGRATGITE